MRIIEWTASHAVSVPEVDDEHQEVFLLCGKLQRAAADRAPHSEIQGLLDEVVIHTAKHFAHEEREMRATGYSHYEWHKRQHQTARSRVQGLARRVRQGDSEAANELAAFLSGWLNDHVRLADRMLGAYLRNYQRRQPLTR